MARKQNDKPRRPAAAGPPPPAAPSPAADGGIRPWHLLLVATAIAVAGGVFASQGTSVVNAVAIVVVITTVAWVAATAARTVAPLVAPDLGEQTEMVGGRTRAALEREKFLVLRSIKEVEFDRAMGKISDADFHEVAGRLRARAAGLLRRSTPTGRATGRSSSASWRRAWGARQRARRRQHPRARHLRAGPERGTCAACGTSNDPDARFCKACGARIEAAR